MHAQITRGLLRPLKDRSAARDGKPCLADFFRIVVKTYKRLLGMIHLGDVLRVVLGPARATKTLTNSIRKPVEQHIWGSKEIGFVKCKIVD
jgi:hypothetical protein